MRDPITFTVPLNALTKTEQLGEHSWTMLPWSDVPNAVVVTVTPGPRIKLTLEFRYPAAMSEPLREHVKTFVRLAVGQHSRRLFKVELDIEGALSEATSSRIAADLRAALERLAQAESRPGAKMNYRAAEHGLGLDSSDVTPAWMVDALNRARQTPSTIPR